jgi:parallel beta-helix repeat protein
VSTPTIWQHSRTLRLGLALALGLTLIIVCLLSIGAFRSPDLALAQGPTVRYVAPAPTGDDSGNDCTDSNAPCATVQHAVDEADPGDEIHVASGVYTDVQARSGITQVVYINKTVTVRGGYTTANWAASDPEANPTTLDAGEQGRVLYVTGNISVTIDGLNITGGNASGLGGGPPSGVDAGGGVLVISATILMSNNQVLSNTAPNGGGMYFYNSAYAALTDNVISNNKGLAKAGGLCFYNSPTATLTANTISNNTANHAGSGQKHFGGALFDHSNNAMLISNTISGNRAANSCGGVCFQASDGVTLIDNAIISNTRLAAWDGFGAGVFLDNSKNARLVGNMISENTGQNIDSLGTILGGGLHIGNNSTATLISNIISSNGATRGGGLSIANSTVTLVSDVITGNTVYDSHGVWNYHPGGGGLYLNNSTVTLTNVVIADNQTETEGSGLYIESSSPDLLHTTITRNSGGDGSGVHITGTLSTVAMTNTILVSHTLGITVEAGNTATLNGVLWYDNGTNYDGPGTIVVSNEHTGDPAFADDGYHLTAASAAIDKGVNAGVFDDIDSHHRPCGLGPDLGVDEFDYCIHLPLILKNL